MVRRLIGHCACPFVRRVGVSPHALGIAFERGLLPVFSDASRCPLAIRSFASRPWCSTTGNVIDSAAILDHLDEAVESERALLPAQGKARRDALQIVALATGLGDKTVAIASDRRRPFDKIDARWIDRF
jgi:glutathione S-transferase